MDDKMMALEALKTAKDSADWAFWSMIGTWVAGVATFCAVLVSLHIANRKPKIYLNASATLSFIMHGPYTQDGLGIDVANVSTMPISISSIFWVAGNKFKMLQIFSDQISCRLPTRLEYGQSAFYFIGFDDSDNWINNFRKELNKHNVSVNDLRLSIRLSSGDEFKFRLHKELIKKISQAN